MKQVLNAKILRKKAAALLLSLLALLTALFAGCALPAGKGSAGRTYAIPKDGVVRGAELAKLRASGGLAIYKGSDHGIRYEWTFVGEDITAPADVDLRVSFEPADAAAMRQSAGGRSLAFEIRQPGPLPGKPSLRITAGTDWPDGACRLYAYDTAAKAASPAGEAHAVDGVVSLTPPGGGEYFFAADTESAASASAGTSSSPSAGASTASDPAASGQSSATAGSVSSAGSASSPPSARAGGDSGPQTAGTSSASAGTAASSGRQPSGGGKESSQSPAAPEPVRFPVTITIRCDTAVKNWNQLKPNKQDHAVVPADGVILPVTTVTVDKGATVYDLLVRVCEDNRIQMEHKGYTAYSSEYIQGIHNLYEFDGGGLSGWMYCVNGWYPNYGVSRYVLKSGDAVQFNYTCDLGRDLPGAAGAVG